MKLEQDIKIRNSDELEKYVDENLDLRYPDSDIRIEFEPRENEIRDIEGKSIFLCTFKDSVVDERFDFLGRDISCWGTCILQDFFGRCFDGGNFVGRDWEGRNGIFWNFEGRDIIYFAVFIAYNQFCCKSIFGQMENSIHQCLNENIEYIDTFKFGRYSPY